MNIVAFSFSMTGIPNRTFISSFSAASSSDCHDRLDQDMMQKEPVVQGTCMKPKRTCIATASHSFPVNFLFLSLGILLLLFASQLNIPCRQPGMRYCLVCGGRPSGIRRTDILYHRHHCSRLFQRRFGIEPPSTTSFCIDIAA